MCAATLTNLSFISSSGGFINNTIVGALHRSASHCRALGSLS
jgi:hypothetical protein